MVMGRDSCLRGLEFKSQDLMLDGLFFAFICVKNYQKWYCLCEQTIKKYRAQ